MRSDTVSTEELRELFDRLADALGVNLEETQ